MKKYLMLFCALNLFITLTVCEVQGYDGKPGCKTQGEIGLTFSNFWDPMKYWECAAANTAISQRCADGYSYQGSLRSCVRWVDWNWIPTVMPPSCPDGVVECVAGISQV